MTKRIIRNRMDPALADRCLALGFEPLDFWEQCDGDNDLLLAMIESVEENGHGDPD